MACNSKSKELAEIFGVGEEEVKAYVKEFNKMDTNKDGKITVDELKMGLASSGVDVTRGQAKMMMEFVDDDNDNQIDLMEYLNMVTRSLKSNGMNVEEEALAAFSKFDINQDGFISIHELRKIMANLGHRMTEKEANRMIKLYDKNKDGKIDYKEFLSAWKHMMGEMG